MAAMRVEGMCVEGMRVNLAVAYASLKHVCNNVRYIPPIYTCFEGHNESSYYKKGINGHAFILIIS